MRIGDRYTMLVGEPVTVVPSHAATAAERRYALERLRARQILWRMAHAAEYEGRHDLVAVFELLSAGRPSHPCDLPTSFYARRVLDAASEGRLLVVPGWCWHESYAATDRHEAAASPEDRVATRIMAGRHELTFEGASYVVLPAVSWAGLREGGKFEVVRQEEAGATLRRMAERARSSQEKTALSEAAAMLADTKKPFAQGGLFLVRRPAGCTFVAASNEPALTPSQLREAAAADSHWVEIHIIDDVTGMALSGARVMLNIPGKGLGEYMADVNGIVHVDEVTPGSFELTELHHDDGTYDFVHMR